LFEKWMFFMKDAWLAKQSFWQTRGVDANWKYKDK
jgi:hypothetical protein